jgi:hypothetical protein
MGGGWKLTNLPDDGGGFGKSYGENILSFGVRPIGDIVGRDRHKAARFKFIREWSVALIE